MSTENIKDVTSNLFTLNNTVSAFTTTIWGSSSQYIYINSFGTNIRFPGATGSRACDGTTVGAIPLPSLSSGETLRIAQVRFDSSGVSAPGVGSFDGSIWLCDRLSDFYSWDPGTASTVQTVNTTSLPRYTDGVGVVAAIESWSTGTLWNGGNYIVNIVDETNSSRTITCSSPSYGSNVVAGSTLLIENPYQGIRSITDIQCGNPALSGTSRNLGLVLFKPIAKFSLKFGVNGRWNPLSNGLPIIQTYGSSSPCLFWLVKSNSNSSGLYVHADIRFLIEK